MLASVKSGVDAPGKRRSLKVVRSGSSSAFHGEVERTLLPEEDCE